MAGEFTTWDDLREAIKDAIAKQIGDGTTGAPMTGEYWKGNRRLRYRSYDELLTLYDKTFDLERLESSGNPSNMVSYGRMRRF